VKPAELAELVQSLLADATVRTGGATHPFLRILGAIEARLVRADRMILAGLEEGVWPGPAPTDPFLSRPMRKTLGLPPPERRLGQTAQDFVQAACADEAILVHVDRRGGQPAVKSRWLWRLEMLTRGADSARDARGAGTALGRRRDRPRAGRPAARSRPLRPPSGTDPACRAPAARDAGDRGRTLGPRSLRRLRPAHPRPEEARPAGRRRRGHGAGQCHPRGHRTHRGDLARGPAARLRRPDREASSARP
jgi:hypothetical protein